MPKGSQQTGSSTTSAESRAGAAQFPYFQAGLQNAGRIYGDETTYPNYAPPSPWQTQGYPDLFAATRPNQVQTGGLYNVADTAGNVQDWPTAKTYDAYGNLIAGGGTSPAQPGYAQFAAGQGGPQQTADRVVGNAVNAAYGYANPITGYASAAGANNNLGLSELGKFASGGYDANPYLPAAIAAAQRPVQLAYQESTAPTTDARFSGAGRYGSGANDAARVRDESALAGSLGDISTNMSYADFKAAMDRKAAASQQYGSLFNQGLTTAGNLQQAAGNLVDQGERTALSAADLTQRGQTAGLSGLDTGFGRGITAEQNALTSFPQFIQSLFAPGLATAQAGAGLSAQQLAAARGEIEAGTGQQTLQQQAYNAPFERLRQYMATIGAPSGGASATQPIFGNPLTSAISGATGLVGLGKELGVGSGLNSLFGGGAGALGSAGSSTLLGSVAGGNAALPLVLAPDIGAAGLSSLAADAAGTSIAPALAAAAGSAAFTIICTELVKQGRMPDTWRRAGMRQFMRYPAIARRGYWVWATPVVAHLRQKPDSSFSMFIATTFNWRAEDLAARAGVKGARRLLRGRLVTAAMVLPCLACGLGARRDYWPIVKDVKI